MDIPAREVVSGGKGLALYSDTVLDHYQNPRNLGAIEDADAVGQAENAACGDLMHLYLKIEGGRIVRACFKTFGCAASIAAGSRLTEMLQGASLAQVEKLSGADVAAALGGLPPMKAHASVLAEDALKAALENYPQRFEKS